MKTVKRLLTVASDLLLATAVIWALPLLLGVLVALFGMLAGSR